MKYIIVSFLGLCFLLSCNSLKEAQPNLPCMHTVQYFDNIQRDKIPQIFDSIYYSKLDSSSVKEAILVRPKKFTSSSVCTLNIKTAFAQDGYLYINEKMKDFINKNNLIQYIVNNDTVNSETKVKNLIALKKNTIKSVNKGYLIVSDSLKMGFIIIKTK